MKAIQILFVRRNNDVLQARGDTRIVEGLAPVEMCLPRSLGQGNGQREVWWRHMPDDDSLRRRFEEHAVVGIVLAVRPMHDKLPSPLGLELKYLEHIAEAIRSPPGCEQVGIRKCGGDLRGGEREKTA